MAATFSFTTTPILSGHSIRIYSTSLNWDQYVPASSSSALLTITTLDGGLSFDTNTSATFTKSLSLTTDLVGDFVIDITSLELYGVDEMIPDDILNVKIDIAGGVTYTYNTNEVFYYNSWKLKSETCYNTVNDINDINSMEIKYACMVNILYNGLIADISVANTGGIYEKIDIFNRLANDLG
jgi:hypothetical protein